MDIESQMQVSNESSPLENPGYAGASAYDVNPVVSKAKSSLRMKYEAETQVISRKLGDLESIRSQLGLSQRKMAQLLLVDPSAWTRWTKGGDQAPPHIYRMLQWYLTLEDKYPALDVNFWLNTVAQVTEKSEVSRMQNETRVELLNVRDELTNSRVHAFEFQRRIEMNEKAMISLKKKITAFAAIASCVGLIAGLALGFWLR